MRRPGVLILVLMVLPSFCQVTMTLPLRSRVEAFKGSAQWEEVRFQKRFAVRETAILICDMWDNHWCKGATQRVDEMVKRMAPVIDAARAGGIRVIHSPSDVMDFYENYPQRKQMPALTQVAPPEPMMFSDPPLPIDDLEGGCDTGGQEYKAWSRQHAGIHIAPEDVISDKGTEVYSYLRANGIGNLLLMGVHTNMCVLNRTFAIKQMTKWGVRCVLVRDLTDSMYDPKKYPFVTHGRGTELVIEHIEKYWCPTVLSSDLTKSLKFASTATGRTPERRTRR